MHFVLDIRQTDRQLAYHANDFDSEFLKSVNIRRRYGQEFGQESSYFGLTMYNNKKCEIINASLSFHSDSLDQSD